MVINSSRQQSHINGVMKMKTSEISQSIKEPILEEIEEDTPAMLNEGVRIN
jgi:hypothetical protein